jgi:hypothetical protein
VFSFSRSCQSETLLRKIAVLIDILMIAVSGAHCHAQSIRFTIRLLRSSRGLCGVQRARVLSVPFLGSSRVPIYVPTGSCLNRQTQHRPRLGIELPAFAGSNQSRL